MGEISTNFKWVYLVREVSAMAMIGKPDRGTVEMNSEECKGCGLCVEACPPKVLHLAEEPESLWLPSRGLRRQGLHRLRHLFLRLSRTGRHTGVPAGGRLGECACKNN